MHDVDGFPISEITQDVEDGGCMAAQMQSERSDDCNDANAALTAICRAGCSGN